MKNRLMIYGATGTVGRVVARQAEECWREANRKGQLDIWARPPALAGRDVGALRALGGELGLPWIAVSLDDADGLRRAMADAAVVINAAGPFEETAEPIVKACLRTGTHYLDLCGELDVFRRLDNYNLDALDLGVLLMPGVGFVVLASDYLLRGIHKTLKDEGFELTQVRVALSRLEIMPRGTVKSMIESIREGVLVRRHGRLVHVPAGQVERQFRFAGVLRTCTAVQLPDLITAPATIRAVGGSEELSVETFGEMRPLERLNYSMSGIFASVLQASPVRDWLLRQADLLPAEPGGDDREQCLVVEGSDRHGARREVWSFRVPDADAFSAWSSVMLAEAILKILAKGPYPPEVPIVMSGLEKAFPLAGFRTPASTFYGVLDSRFGASKASKGKAGGSPQAQRTLSDRATQTPWVDVDPSVTTVQFRLGND